jgi:TolA-binding protein
LVAPKQGSDEKAAPEEQKRDRRDEPVEGQRAAAKPKSGAAKQGKASATPAAPQSARELFSAANLARRSSDVARATQLYRQLQHSFPSSSEAQLSLVTLGTLQLDSGNAGGALATFNRYLNRGGGPLRAEAMYGRALAFSRLGRGADEQRAWQSLVQQHPGSGYANKARERLSALAAR